MNIRPATLADVDGIALAHVEAWKTAYREILPASYLASLARESRKSVWQEILNRTAPAEFTFIAEADDRIIGFATGGPERTGDPDYVGELYAIYLLEPFQRRSIGSELFCRGVETLRRLGLNSLKVWVLKENPCRSFYERHGGRVLGEKQITIAETPLLEVAYGWKPLENFRRMRRAQS